MKIQMKTQDDRLQGSILNSLRWSFRTVVCEKTNKKCLNGISGQQVFCNISYYLFVQI